MTASAEKHRHSPQFSVARLLRGGHVHHPALVEVAEGRRDNFQLRLADRITAFAGSMNFVWLHAVVFAVWMVFVEKNPWPTLTLVVSLEAIFLSTFVMIGQNRQAAFQQAKADHDYHDLNQMESLNTDLTKEIHQLTVEIHHHVLGTETSSPES